MLLALLRGVLPLFKGAQLIRMSKVAIGLVLLLFVSAFRAITARCTAVTLLWLRHASILLF